MDYQDFAIIFVLIVLPLSLILSYYIDNQTDTITAQTTYQSKLTDSVYDAVSAYEINSMNTQSVKGESIKSYVKASINTFFTTLATNFGMSSASKSRLLPYVPAILFTTYDGYYIYSPIKTKQVAINEQNGQVVQTQIGDIVYAKSGSDENAYKVKNNDAVSIKDNSQLPATYKNRLTTSSGDAAKDQKSYLLKPFIYYSAQYDFGVSSSDHVVASYSLDNYLTVYGYKNNNREGVSGSIPSSTPYITADFTKSGYLIDPGKIGLNGNLLIKMLAKKDGETEAESQSASDVNSFSEIIANNDDNSGSLQKNNVRYYSIDVNTLDAYNYINYYEFNERAIFSWNGKYYSPNKVKPNNVSGTLYQPIRTQTGNEIISDTLELNDIIEADNSAGESILFPGNYYNKVEVTYNGVNIEDKDAKEYYIKAYFFSKWVQNNLKDIKAENVNQDFLNWASMSNDTKTAYTDFTDDETLIFDIGANNNPESDSSPYQEHKRNVIKNSIQYNLNLAISTYNDTFYQNDATQAFRLPIIAENDWQSILNNISMTAFLQGVPAGTKKFNSYATVQSSNNNTSVSIDNMYFVKESEWDNGVGYYHSYDCPELKGTTGTEYLADMSSRFKYDAEKVLAKIDDAGHVICLYEDSTNTYYEISEVNGEISLGNIIPLDNVTSYNYKGQNYDLTTLATDRIDTLSDNKYKYDHKNLACYTCNISRNYVPIVKYYKGDLRRTYATEDGDLLIEMSSGNFVFYSNGKQYNGSAISESDLIGDEELQRRRKAVYTYIANLRNGLYKSNDYVNR